MRRTAVAAVLAAGLLVGGVSACGGDPKPKLAHSADPSPTMASSSPAPSQDPTPPEIPEVAKQHTVAGAKAFVHYYWDIANYAQHTLDARRLRSLGDENCDGCRGAEAFIERVKKGQGSIRGGDTSLTNLNATRVGVAGQVWISITYTYVATPQVVDFPGRKNDEKYPGGRGRDRMTVKPVSGGWEADYLEVLK